MNAKKFLITLALLLFYSPSLVYAQTASPSANPIRDAVNEKVQQEVDQIKKAVAKRGYVGTITAKSDASLTLTNLKSQPRTIIVTADSTIKLSGGKDGTPADIKVGDSLIAMGDVDSANVMTAKRIVIVPKPVPDTRQAVFVTVTKTTVAALTVENLKKETLTIKLNTDTKYTAKTKATDLVIGSKLVIVARPTSTASILTGLAIHLLVP